MTPSQIPISKKKAPAAKKKRRIKRKVPVRESVKWAVAREEQIQKALYRRKLPVMMTVEDLLRYEYRRGLMVATLEDDDPIVKKAADRVRKLRHSWWKGTLDKGKA